MSVTPSPNFGAQDGSQGIDREQSSQEKKSWIWGLLFAVLLIGGVSHGFYSWSLHNRLQEMENAMQMQFGSQAESIQGLQDQIGTTDTRLTDLQGEVATTSTHLGSTRSELTQTRQMADQLARQQKESSEQLAGQLGSLQQEQADTKGAVGTLSTDVTGVRQEVTVTKQDLAATRSDLQRAIGDLGVQSGLIARNKDELDELRLRGERDYIEFDLRKAKQPQRYGTVGLQLKKADVKRQKYTVDLIADDRRIEKKDKNTNEPVQFYQQGYRIPTEIVVNRIDKDRIVGYISVPKVRATEVSSVESQSPVASGSGS
jgi:septal ring factor EnvC (AmiA/AmiB activator)